MNKYDAGIVCPNRWLVGQELITLALQVNDIFIQAVGTKAEVVNTGATLFQVLDQGPLTI